MPRIQVVFYQEIDGRAPVLDWLEELPDKVRDKCLIKIERLQELGFELRRPEADLLRDGIHELRVKLRRMNYRILYFFHQNVAAVLAHGTIKDRRVPTIEIERARQRKERFRANPGAHTYVGR